MVHNVYYVLTDDLFEVKQVHDKSRIWIDFTSNRYLELEIMPVVILVGTFSKNAFVRCSIPFVVPKFVRRTKVFFSLDVNHA
jgi:hypothetical protein